LDALEADNKTRRGSWLILHSPEEVCGKAVDLDQPERKKRRSLHFDSSLFLSDGLEAAPLDK
jgi:hypothetical protein